jgi:hypothetical protein
MDITTKQMEEEEVAEAADVKMKVTGQSTPEKKTVNGRSPRRLRQKGIFAPPESVHGGGSTTIRCKGK